MNLEGTDPELLLAHDGRLRALARALVGDGSGADDLVQDTWLAWLERGAGVRSLSGWLATLVRRAATRERRARARRERREASVARPEAGPSTAEILEREEARARVVAALERLAEPLRTTLVLRFLEDLPPRAVAARMNVPVETARTRTRRGLAALRAELDRSFETRARWTSALLPLVRAPRSSVGLTLAAMSIPATLAVSTAAVALCAWLLWPRGPAASTAVALPTLVGDSELAAPALDAGAADLVASAGPAAGTRAPAAQPEPSVSQPSFVEPGGALRVRVLGPRGSRAPAGGVSEVVVRVTPGERENPDLHALSAVTDAAGHALFEDVPAGQVLVTADRSFSSPLAATVVPGTRAELEIRLRHGFDIVGLVTDEAQRPVAGAEIWLGRLPDLAHGACVARSASDGSFHLRGLTHANLGARASGHRPSRIAHFFAAPEAEVSAHLVLRAGAGAVRGALTDLSGRPVPGAFVRVGAPGPTERTGNHDLDEDWGTVTRTDDEGRFHVEGVSAGPCPLLVRCAGFALLRDEVEVPLGGCASFSAALVPEAALEGHVRDARGAPLSGARVRVRDAGEPPQSDMEEGAFRASARTRADGSFRVGALEAGRTLQAWIEDAPGSARTEFQCEAGESAVWEAVLEPLGTIRGRVLDERGAALAGWIVTLSEQRSGELEPDRGSVPTEADGSFSFSRVHDRPHQLALSAPRSGFLHALARSNVRPGPDELVLRVTDAMVPSARVVGTFLDEAGQPLARAQLVPWLSGSTEAAFETCDPLTGRFELGPYPAGSMQLLLQSPGRGALVRGPHELVPGEIWDLGEVRLEPEGRLRVRLVPQGLEPDGSLALSIEPFWEPFEGAGDERLSPPLAPRAYTLRVGGGAFEELALPFAIESGAETMLDVPLRRGWRTRIAVRAPDSVALGRLLVHLPLGTLEGPLWQREDELLVETLHLPAGRFAVEATAGELCASGTLVVEPFDRDEPALVLTLE